MQISSIKDFDFRLYTISNLLTLGSNFSDYLLHFGSSALYFYKKDVQCFMSYELISY